MEAYANFTGLMWENAREFGALLLFAEVGTAISSLNPEGTVYIPRGFGEWTP